MHMAGAGWWGWEAYTNPKRTAGRLENVGSGDTLGDNGTAAQILTVLPFIAVYLLVSKNKKLKALAFLVGAVRPQHLHSVQQSRRNARAGRRRGVRQSGSPGPGIGLARLSPGVAMAGGLFYLADPQFLQRQQFTTDYENDGSAKGRLEAWRGGVELVKDHPFGAGGQGFWELSPIYAADLVDSHGGETRSAQHARARRVRMGHSRVSRSTSSTTSRRSCCSPTSQTRAEQRSGTTAASPSN